MEEGSLMEIGDIAGKDRPIIVNEKGGGQSHVPVRFDLIDGKALFNMAAVLHEGAEKYGDNNWRKIDIDDHLNHLIMHAYAYLAGDRSDEHLSHIMCRAMFAQAVAIQEDITTKKFAGLSITTDSSVPKDIVIVALPDGTNEVWKLQEDGVYDRVKQDGNG